jgi:hypothetical protein
MIQREATVTMSNTKESISIARFIGSIMSMGSNMSCGNPKNVDVYGEVLACRRMMTQNI